MLGKLLYKLFKRQFLKYYFLDQSAKKGFEKMKKAFVDSNGKIYYTTENDFDTPLQRIRGIERCVRQIMAGLSEDENKKLVQAMKKALNEGRKPDLARIGFIITEIERREEMVLHPDVMYDLLAYKYVREDEDPAIINSSIHQAKIDQFKIDSMDGLYDFFCGMGLTAYMPYLTKLEKDWEDYWRESKAKVRALEKQTSEYLFGQS
jgi:hypothetical protein